MCVRILQSQVCPQFGHQMLPNMTEIPNINEEKSPYERILYNLHHDQKTLREISAGKRVGFYKFRGELGRGNFSTVKLGHHLLTKDKVAIKIIEKSKLDHKTQRMLNREISNMEGLTHPNIIRLFEVVETYSRINLVLEFAPEGELFNKISAEGKLTESKASYIFCQILSAISYLHDISIVHRDIKAENVFLARGGHVKLGDFGFSTKLNNQAQKLSTFCGSPPYAAPELYKDESYRGPAVDLWALGVLMFFMLTADMPFKASTVAGLKRQILASTFVMPTHVSFNAKDLINKLLVKCPDNRLSALGASNHQWLYGYNIYQESMPSYINNPRPYVPPDMITTVESLTFEVLEKWGIKKDLLYQGMTVGSRSAVVATYKIFLHHLLEKTNESNQDTSRQTTPTPSPNSSQIVTPKRKLYLRDAFNTKKPKSRMCTIL